MNKQFIIIALTIISSGGSIVNCLAQTKQGQPCQDTVFIHDPNNAGDMLMKIIPCPMATLNLHGDGAGITPDVLPLLNEVLVEDNESKITHFNLVINKKGKVKTIEVLGSKLPEAALKEIKSLRPGNTILITEIIQETRFGNSRKLLDIKIDVIAPLQIKK